MSCWCIGDSVSVTIPETSALTLCLLRLPSPPLVDYELLEKLGEAFSMEKNEKGYKQLPDQVRMIQGDGIDHESLAVICALLVENGWSINNIIH